MPRTELDQTDAKILAELQKDARQSNVELAKRIGLSPSPCLARVRALEKSGVIGRYVALVDPDTVGLGVSVFIQVTLERQVERALEAFEAKMHAFPEVMECYLMTGEADAALGALVLVSTTLYALAALAFAARAFGNERVLFGGGEAEVDARAVGPLAWLRARRGALGVPSSSAVLLFVSFVAVAFFWVGIRLQVSLGESGLLAAEWLLLLTPAVAFVVFGGFDPVRTLSLRRPTRTGVAGGMILIAGAMPLVWVLGWLQTFVLPVPWEMLEGLEQLVTADSAGRLAWLLLLLAVTPALCEEAVFRGVLLGGTGEAEPWRRVVLNGVVFGLFHLSFETVIRFLPTATLGMVIAWAVLRTGSIWVGVLMHFLNNGAIVVLASTPGVREYFSDPEAPPPLWLVPVAAVLVWAGARVLQRPAAAAGADTSNSSHDP